MSVVQFAEIEYNQDGSVEKGWFAVASTKMIGRSELVPGLSTSACISSYTVCPLMTIYIIDIIDINKISH
jgi:hypothetical protein